MTEPEEKALRGTIENLMTTVRALENGQALLSAAMMKLIGRLEALEKTADKRPKLFSPTGRLMNG